MNTQTQLNWIREQLKTYGRISRNECLNKFITRLGARICDLKKEGMDISGHFEETDYGKDFVYYIKEQIKLI
jgi:hypothetical protein